MIDDALLGEKRIKLRGSNDNIWTRVEHVVKDINGHPLYIVCRDDVVYPWHAIEQIAPLGR